MVDTKITAKYDEIVADCFAKIYMDSLHGARIAIADFDPKNQEHLFVLGVAKGVGSVLEKQIALDLSPWRLAQMNRGVPHANKILRMEDEDYPTCINAKELVAIMRRKANEVFEVEDFDLSDIYREYYHIPTNRKRKTR